MTNEMKNTNAKQSQNTQNGANLWVACYLKSQLMKAKK